MQVTAESILLHQSQAFHIRHPWSRPWDGFIRYLYVNYQVRICEFVPGICMYICVHCLCSLFLFWRHFFIVSLTKKRGNAWEKSGPWRVCACGIRALTDCMCVSVCASLSLFLFLSLSFSLSLCSLSLCACVILFD